MSDATDAVAEAIALHRQLAAKAMVRKDELEAEIAARQARGASTAELETELAGALADAKAAMDEIKELRRIGLRSGSPALPDDLGLDGLIDPSSPAPRRQTRADADAEALAKFKALREKAQGGGGGGGDAGGGGGEAPPPRTPGKKTL
jgi:hypothetical protein